MIRMTRLSSTRSGRFFRDDLSTGLLSPVVRLFGKENRNPLDRFSRLVSKETRREFGGCCCTVARSGVTFKCQRSVVRSILKASILSIHRSVLLSPRSFPGRGRDDDLAQGNESSLIVFQREGYKRLSVINDPTTDLGE